jgi:hypothetical protein
MAKNKSGFLSFFAVPNLTLYLILMIGITSILLPMVNPSIGQVSLESVMEGRYLDIALKPFRLNEHPIIIVLILFIIWSFGIKAESEMGYVAYSFYIYSGYLLLVFGGLFFPLYLDTSFLLYSIFMILGYLSPKDEIIVFFFIPAKMWVMSILIALYAIFPILQIVFNGGPVLVLAAPLIGFGNFILFAGFGFIKDKLTHKTYTKRIQPLKAPSVKQASIHKCHICGKTEQDDPNLDFRYCAECDGDIEYCMDHLHNHEHVKAPGFSQTY